MKNILFILHSYSVGGAERRCVMIANHLASKGIKVKIVLLDIDKMYTCASENSGTEIGIRLSDAPKTYIPADSRVELVYLLHQGEDPGHDPRIRYIPYDENDKIPQSAMDHLFPAESCDHKVRNQLNEIESIYTDRIYHYVKQHPDFRVISWMTFCNLATAIAVKSLPNEFAFVECTSPYAEFSGRGPINTIKKVLYPRANAAFFQTEEIRDFYSYLPGLSAFIIPNPVMPSLPSVYNGERKKIIVTFCRIEKPKNLGLLLDAFAVFHRDFPDYQLHIIGEGSEKPALQTKCSQLELDNVVTFKDYDDRVHEKVVDCAMFVSTSEREGISNSMLEALAIGLPTVCTDCSGGGAKTAIVNGINGFLVPTNNTDAVYRAMKKIVTTDGLAEKLSSNAAKVRDSFSLNSIGEAWYRAVTSSWTT